MNRGIAAFDFDGTLVPGDSLRGFLSRLLGRQRFAVVLGQAAPAMARAYRVGGRDAAKAALLERAVAGIAAEQAEEVGQAYAAHLASRVRPHMAERLSWHVAEEHETVVVSASLAVYLEPFGRMVGFDHVIATRLEVGPGALLTGRLDGRNVRAQQKAVLLTEFIGPDPATLWAYGDSRGDLEMLAMADHPTLLRWRTRRAAG